MPKGPYPSPDPFAATAQYTDAAPVQDRDPNHLFDVTCVVGSVYRDDSGQFTPLEAAFLMIARHEGNGEFHFPDENGNDICVAVALPPRTPTPHKGAPR